jgi:GT2 family glycosyltransferase
MHSNLNQESCVCQREPQLDCQAIRGPDFAVAHLTGLVRGKHLYDPRTYHHYYRRRAALTYQEGLVDKDLCRWRCPLLHSSRCR